MITEELLEKCKNKDTGAWNYLVRRWNVSLIRIVRYKVSKLGLDLSTSEIEDIVQDMFLMLWEKDKLLSIKSSKTFKGWLIITTLNFTSAYCRKFLDPSKIMTSLEKPVNSSFGDLILKNIIPDNNTLPSQIIESTELKGILEKEISYLPHKQQLALILNVFDNKKQKDIAGIMGLPEGTVATLLNRAKRELQSKMDLYEKK